MYFLSAVGRSRTAWLAAFLSSNEKPCYHEGSVKFSNPVAYEDALLAGAGDSTSLLLITRMHEVYPEAPVVVIQRDILEVYRSSHNAGLPVELNTLLDLQEAQLNIQGLHVCYEDIDKRLPEICEYISVPYDLQKHKEFKNFNIQQRTMPTKEEIDIMINSYREVA